MQTGFWGSDIGVMIADAMGFIAPAIIVVAFVTVLVKMMRGAMRATGAILTLGVAFVFSGFLAAAPQYTAESEPTAARIASAVFGTFQDLLGGGGGGSDTPAESDTPTEPVPEATP
jgi:uncharacterized membrane protein YkgB